MIETIWSNMEQYGMMYCKTNCLCTFFNVMIKIVQGKLYLNLKSFLGIGTDYSYEEIV